MVLLYQPIQPLMELQLQLVVIKAQVAMEEQII